MKQMDSRTVDIGENRFYIYPMPAFTAARLSGEISSVLVPLLSALAPLGGVKKYKDQSILDVDLSDALPAISNAFGSLSGNMLEKLLKDLLINSCKISVEIEGKAQRLTEDISNEIFCGDIEEMFELAFEVIKMNYSGFFEKVASQFGKAMSKMEEAKNLKDMENSTQPISQN